MKVIQRKRNKGKTTELVGLLLDYPDAILLVYDCREARRIVAEYQIDESKGLRVTSWNHYRTHPEIWNRTRPLLIDNVDMFLAAQLHNQTILGISVNEN